MRKVKFNKFGIFENDKIDEILAKKIFQELQCSTFKKIKQKKTDHYKHIFKNKLNFYPNDSQKYEAEFSLIESSENLVTFNNFFYKTFIPQLKHNFPELKFFLYHQINQIKKNTFWRCHNDNYAGTIGYTFIFSDNNWTWDNGGIIHFIKDDDLYPIKPLNGLSILRNEQLNLPHFVTNVPSYVSSCYYIIVGWAGAEDLGSSSIRGDYISFDEH